MTVYLDDPRHGWDDWIKQGPPDVKVESGALTASGDFDESKHPRDSHGRFGEGDGTEGVTLDRRGAEKLLGIEHLPHLPANAFLSGGAPPSWLKEAGAAKSAIASDLAGRMTVSTDAIVKATGGDDIRGNPQYFIGRAEGGMIVNYQTAPPFSLTDVDGNPVRPEDPPTDVLYNGKQVSEFRLATDPESDGLFREQGVSRLVRQWANTSGDSSQVSLAIQEAARREFGLDTAPIDVAGHVAESRDAEYAENGAVYHDFLRSQYEATQEQLSAAGVSAVELHRGVNWQDADTGRAVSVPDWAKQDGEATVASRPLSSWSSNPSIAHGFTYGVNGNVLEQTVPAARILSYARTGNGSLSENEFVVLGSQAETVRVRQTGPWSRSGFAVSSPETEVPFRVITRNEDWLRTMMWDLPLDPEAFRPGELDAIAKLPAGEAMPANLRGALTAAGDWDEEDHPRDEHGRFEGGGDTGTPLDEPSGEMIHLGPEDIALSGTVTGEGSLTDPIFVGKDLDQAVALLAEGKSIRLSDEKEVATLVSKLGEYSKELRDRGEKAPDFDLCKVSVEGRNLFCHENLGIPRVEMPQLSGKAEDGSPAAALRKDPSNSDESVSVETQYIQALRNSGVTVTDRMIPAEQLRATQNEINGGKTGNILNGMLRGGTVEGGKQIWTTKDGYVLDGHHRWVAAIAFDDLNGGDGNAPIHVHEVGMEIGAALDFTKAYTEKMGIRQMSASQFGLALLRFVTLHDLFSLEAHRATFDFDEAKHPRDEKGRFGEGGGGRPHSGESARQIIGVENPDTVTNNEAAVAKSEVAGALSDRMSSSTDDLIAAAYVPSDYVNPFAQPGDPPSLFDPLAMRGNHDYVIARNENGEIYGAPTDNLWGRDSRQVDPDGPIPSELLGGSTDVVRADDPKADDLLRESAVSTLVANWSITSNDSNSKSLGIQQAATDEFGLKTAGWQVDADTAQRVAADYEAHGAVYRDFVRSQYDATQELLQQHGVTSVTLTRGFAWADSDGNEIAPPAWAQRNGSAELDLRPMSSWTTQNKTAEFFAGGEGYEGKGTLVQATIPAERIMSTPRTGVGCLAETEFVILGQEKQPVITDRFGSGWDALAAAGAPGLEEQIATRNEDWIRTVRWDLPTDPDRFRPGELAALAELPAGEAMPPALRATLTASGDFDESKHPRDALGRFGEGSGAAPEGIPHVDLIRGQVDGQKIDHSQGDFYGLQRALDTVPPNTPVWVTQFEHPNGYTIANGVASRDEHGLTVLKEVSSNPADLSMADVHTINDAARADVENSHAAVVAAFDGDKDLAASLQGTYVLAARPSPDDERLSEKFGRTFRSDASANLMSHALMQWRDTTPTISVAVHESGHQLDAVSGRPSAHEWLSAIPRDNRAIGDLMAEHSASYVRDANDPSHPVLLSGGGVTTYSDEVRQKTGAFNEDFAESFRLYGQEKLGQDLHVVMGDGYRPTFSEAFPARKAVLDDVVANAKEQHRR